MECMRSFVLSVNQNFVFVAPQFNSWNPVGAGLPWTVEAGLSNFPPIFTDFNIQGFKNIDFYGISLVGNCYPTNAPVGNEGIVNDWGVNITLVGNPPLIGGNFGTNSLGFIQGGLDIGLTKYQNIYNLGDPVKSVTRIQISFLRASGFQFQNPATIDLTYDFSLIVYYKFEGE